VANHGLLVEYSKLEQLEKEVQSIKDAVNPNGSARTLPPTPLPLPSPRESFSLFPARPMVSTPVLSVGIPVQSPTQVSQLEQIPTPSLTSHATPTGLPRRGSEPRALGSRVFSGEDIDYYFDQYVDFFPLHIFIFNFSHLCFMALFRLPVSLMLCSFSPLIGILSISIRSSQWFVTKNRINFIKRSRFSFGLSLQSPVADMPRIQQSSHFCLSMFPPNFGM
jgi:hypothetical protein